MKNYIYMLCLFIIFLSGCATTGFNTFIGYSAVKVIKMSGSLGNDRGKDIRSGESCSHNILGLLAFGDSSIAAAKKNGRMDIVSYFDTDILSILGFYGKVCTIAYGLKLKKNL